MKVHGVYLYLYMSVPIPHLTWSGTRKLNSTAVCTGRSTRNGKPICCTAISYFHLLYNIQYRIYIIYMCICICICYTISCSKWKCITIYIYIYIYICINIGCILILMKINGFICLENTSSSSWPFTLGLSNASSISSISTVSHTLPLVSGCWRSEPVMVKLSEITWLSAVSPHAFTNIFCNMWHIFSMV